MVYLNVLLRVKDESNIAKVSDLLREQATRSRGEPGCARFEVYHSDADLCLFMLVEQWQTQADVDRHRTGAAFVEIYTPLVLPLVERTPHPSQRIA
jgi:quinol monooxygenase YgiN